MVVSEASPARTHDPDLIPDLAAIDSAIRTLEAKLAANAEERKAIKEELKDQTRRLRVRIREAVEVGLFNRGEGAEGGGG